MTADRRTESEDALRTALTYLDTMIDRQTLTGAVAVRGLVEAALAARHAQPADDGSALRNLIRKYRDDEHAIWRDQVPYVVRTEVVDDLEALASESQRRDEKAE